MKLAEIEVGKEYGTHDHPTRRYARTWRRARVLGIEVVEKQQYSAFRSGSSPVKKRMVKVELLDEPKGGRWSGAIATAVKGAVILIEPRMIVAPYGELHPNIAKATEKDEVEAKAKAVMEERILALLPKKYKDERWGYLSVYSTGYGPNESGKKKVWVDARFSGDGLDIILALAEQGAAAAALS